MSPEFDVLITDPRTGKQTGRNPDGTFDTIEKARKFIGKKLPDVKLSESGESPAIDFYDEKKIRRAIIFVYE